jgi:hypothetical protein
VEKESLNRPVVCHHRQLQLKCIDVPRGQTPHVESAALVPARCQINVNPPPALIDIRLDQVEVLLHCLVHSQIDWQDPRRARSFLRSDPFTEKNHCPGINWLSVSSMSTEMFSSVAFILYNSSLLTTARHPHLSSVYRRVNLVPGA